MCVNNTPRPNKSTAADTTAVGGGIITLSCGLISAMSEREGILRMQSSGRWAICCPGRDPVEIMSGDLFRVEVDGELCLARMEHLWGEGYYCGYPLRDGIRAAIGSGE
jgi:hypothetical protein